MGPSLWFRGKAFIFRNCACNSHCHFPLCVCICVWPIDLCSPFSHSSLTQRLSDLPTALPLEYPSRNVTHLISKKVQVEVKCMTKRILIMHSSVYCWRYLEDLPFCVGSKTQNMSLTICPQTLDMMAFVL